jgi:hypothetical protein
VELEQPPEIRRRRRLGRGAGAPTESRGLCACELHRRNRGRPRLGELVCRRLQGRSAPAVFHPAGVARRPEAESGGDRERGGGGGEEEGPHVQEAAPYSVRLRRLPSTTWGRPLALLLPRSAGFGRRRISRPPKARPCSMLPTTERVCGWTSSHRRREGRTGSSRRSCPAPAWKGERHSGAAVRRSARGRGDQRRERGGGGVGGRRRIKKSDRWAPQMLVGVEYEI